jgi:hypothetical protein
VKGLFCRTRSDHHTFRARLKKSTMLQFLYCVKFMDQVFFSHLLITHNIINILIKLLCLLQFTSVKIVKNAKNRSAAPNKNKV